MELFLKSDNELGYKPIKELETLRKRTLCETDDTFGVDEINGAIENIRGDMLEISFVLTVDSRGESGEAGIAVRHNPFGTEFNTESTRVVFGSKGVYVDRSKTSKFVNLSDSDTYGSVKDSYNVRIYLDRSMLEIYIDDGAAITTRVYPMYSDSDYLRFFAKDCTAKISGLKIYELGSAYTDEVVPAYYGNTGSIKEAK